MRKCNHCGTEKDEVDFVKHSECRNGITRMCKNCELEKRHSHRKTMHGRIMATLHSIKGRCFDKNNINFNRYGGRGIGSNLTYEDLIRIWERDGADKLKSPSIDRIDIDGDYELSNCQFIERSENIAKDKRVKIGQYDHLGNLVKEWPSMADAEKCGFHHTRISCVCNGKNKTHRGYYWKFI